AVLSGVTPDGNIYYDSPAHTNAVLNAVDWINVMAYDGGDGERHSGYDFSINCGKYWKETRGLPAHKVVLGVPFYARPSWAAYSEILKTVTDADTKDIADFNGVQAYYNGVDTITKKTKYAKENLGGIMIWEISQDTTDKSKSLLQAIGNAAK
ncbi:MAG: glycosyl hydrolase family 18 protein, partial [Oscillospiraceae bacterium]